MTAYGLHGWVQKVILPEVWTDDTVVRDLCCHLSDLIVSASPQKELAVIFLFTAVTLSIGCRLVRVSMRHVL